MKKLQPALYHYTSHNAWELVQKEGRLLYGDVPLSPTTGTQGVWLTTDPDAGKQGWAGSTPEVRLRVRIPDARSAHLVKWTRYAREHKIDPRWLEHLDQSGGGGSDNWYVYLGAIPFIWLKERVLLSEPDPSTRPDYLIVCRVTPDRTRRTFWTPLVYGPDRELVAKGEPPGTGTQGRANVVAGAP
jgi:hypothetical protein